MISHNGASGVYPGSTDLAYQQAVDDGADVIDCSVQMSKDGVAFCSDSADLASSTTAKATFLSRAATIPEIQSKNGIFSFDLSWSEIQTLQRKLLKTSSNLLHTYMNENYSLVYQRACKVYCCLMPVNIMNKISTDKVCISVQL